MTDYQQWGTERRCPTLATRATALGGKLANGRLFVESGNLGLTGGERLLERDASGMNGDGFDARPDVALQVRGRHRCQHRAGGAAGEHGHVAPQIAGVIGELPVRRIRSVVVVDNASTDNTAQVARDAGAVVLRESRIGHGAACRRALIHLESLPQPPDVVTFMAGDHTDDPSDFSRLVEPILVDNAELVIGVRRRDGDHPLRRDSEHAAEPDELRPHLAPQLVELDDRPGVRELAQSRGDPGTDPAELLRPPLPRELEDRRGRVANRPGGPPVGARGVGRGAGQVQQPGERLETLGHCGVVELDGHPGSVPGASTIDARFSGRWRG